MRIGHSIITSEIVDAVNAEYGDCARYQIVCPCCREAVFKGKREPVSMPPTHYFSHYRASDEEARMCEMRVAALAKHYAAKPLFDGHEQSLRYFMAVFRDAIVDAQDKAGIIPAGTLRRDIRKILARHDRELWERPLRRMFDIGTEAGCPGFAPPMREDCAKHLGKIPAFADRSLFWLRRQASYYLDIITHIVTAQAADNFSFMAAACYSALVRAPGLYAFPDETEGWHVEASGVASALLSGAKSETIMQKWGRKITDAERAGHDAGRDAAIAYKDDLGRMLGIDITPRSRAALLSSAGGSVFAEACRIPRDVAASHAEEMRKHALLREAELKALRDDSQDTASKMVLLHVTARIWPVFIGLVASVPWCDLGKDQLQPHSAVSSDFHQHSATGAEGGE